MPEPFASLFTLANLAVALIAMNFLAFAAFGIDKAKAELGKRRIAESTLLLLAFLGGTPGAPSIGSGLGRAAFRHKRRASSRSAASFIPSPGCRWWRSGLGWGGS
ncbi:MAG: DUF1294 domain-containing protein [Novosphingobium sp.]